MRDNSRTVLAVIWCAFLLALACTYRSYVEKHRRLPGQPVTWLPAEPATPPPQPDQRRWKIEKTLDGHVKVVPTYSDFERRVPNAGPDRWDGYRWQYRR